MRCCDHFLVDLALFGLRVFREYKVVGIYRTYQHETFCLVSAVVDDQVLAFVHQQLALLAREWWMPFDLRHRSQSRRTFNGCTCFKLVL